MVTRLSILLSLCCITFAAQVCAAGLPSPTVEYSADRSIETEAGTMQGKLYSAKGKERSENDAGGMQTVMILRRDKQLGYMLMPAQKMYQQLDFSKAQQQTGAAAEDQVEITAAGRESVEGRDTTKYKMLMKDGSGGGFIWITAEGIPLKMDLLSKTDGAKTRITMTLKNLQIADQDPQLFELPADYSEMPGMGTFGRAAAQAVTQSAGEQTRAVATEEANKVIAEESAKSIGKRLGFGVLRGALSKLGK
ncbi:MAG TPA: DUF4412 domain-containing protein [Steroidobacteraceae bacterium]|jgi:hypothetical protein